jgi:hypothetical protein
MVKKQYVYFNPLTANYFFNQSSHPKDDKRIEIRNGDTFHLSETIKQYVDLRRKGILYVGESVPEEVRKGIKHDFQDSRIEVEVKKGL